MGSLIETLYAVYSFLTDIPTMIDVIAPLTWIGGVSNIVAKAQRKTDKRALHWLAGSVTFTAIFAAYYAAYRMIGLPSWMGWLV